MTNKTEIQNPKFEVKKLDWEEGTLGEGRGRLKIVDCRFWKEKSE
jgi:hypothetical protein